MKSYQLIYQIIQLVEQLEQENPDRELSILDFAGFLNKNVMSPAPDKDGTGFPFGKNEAPAKAMADQIDNNIGRLISFLSRYAKIYIKKALEGTPLHAVEDFSCLAILLTHDHLSKFELIGLNVQEKTSGVQVIQRLINAGLAKQWDDPKDKRGKRIAITEDGRKLLYTVFKDMSDVGKIVTGALTAPEKLTVLYLLEKLEFYHRKHYDNKSVTSKSDLHKEALKITGGTGTGSR